MARSKLRLRTLAHVLLIALPLFILKYYWQWTDSQASWTFADGKAKETSRSSHYVTSGRTVFHEIDTLQNTEQIATSIGEYIHLTNVVLNTTTNTLYVFDVSEKVQNALRKLSATTVQLPSYKRHVEGKQIRDMPQPTIMTVPNRHMEPAVDCPTDARNEAAYFYSPWVTSNLFHTLHDNVLAMVDNILQSPVATNSGECPTGECAGEGSLPKTLYLFPGDPNEHDIAPVKVFREALFDFVKPWTSIWKHEQSKAQSVCFAQFHWGRGPTFFYMDGLQTRAQRAVEELNSRVRSHLHLPSRSQVEKASGEQIRAVYVNRDGASSRVIRDPIPILEACREMGWTCIECCVWENTSVRDVLEIFVHAHVILGPHGAGLFHILFARPHATLVDFGEPLEWTPQFTKMVTSLPGSLVVVPEAPSFYWTKDVALRYLRKVNVTAVT